MAKKQRVYLYDSTLRDGGQTSGVSFNARDKKEIALMIDLIGIDYIEGGWPGANPTDDQFFAELPKLKRSQFSAFGMTRRINSSAANDEGLNALINTGVKNICIVGKSWDFHLKNALNISKEENLALISQSIAYIKKKHREAFFDAEHFFDGYKDNPKFALNCIKAAYDAGARWVILCDTNGGSLPSEIKKIVSEVVKIIPGENIGIHCHNDTGNAIANSIAAVEAGARQIQGTINGLGERCGNADLISLIPTLMLKMNYDVGIKENELKNLTKLSNFLDETLNKERNKYAPYVGENAFAHKGGLHVSAINKNPKCYEHIDPEIIGNKRKVTISDQSGRANIISKLKEIGFKDRQLEGSHIIDLVNKVKDQEAKGYAYDSADASFEVLAKKSLGMVPHFFDLISFKVIDERSFDRKGNIDSLAEAIIKIKIGQKIIMTVAEGNGPVNALDKALRKALSRRYPILKQIKLVDYKVRILTPSDATKAITRVQIESSDGQNNKWSSIGVSGDIINASYLALCDSITYILIKNLKV